MRTVKLLRFEDAEGYGMYQHKGDDNPSAAYNVFGVDAMSHVDPLRDKKLLSNLDNLHVPEEYYYAFKNVKMLRKWVYRDDWLQGLHECGIFLAEYRCCKEDVVHGGHQSVFRSHVRKKQHSIRAYFKLT